MSKIVFFTLVLLSSKVRSVRRLDEDFQSKFSSQELNKLHTVGFDVLDFRNSSTKSLSEGRFAHTNVLRSNSNRVLKSIKLNMSKLKNHTNFSNNCLDICNHKLVSVYENAKSTLISPWYSEVFRGLFYAVKKCHSEADCYRKRILRGMDRMIEMKSVKLTEGIFLVKDQEEDVSTMPRDSESEPFMIAVFQRIVRVLETHALRVRLGIMKENESEARIGHHGYRHAFPMMVGSFMLLASFMVPMGFQFLAVVGGKALVLSQIALVMAMGSTLTRFFGFGNQKQGNVGGIVQHEYYVKDDIQPWHRQGSEVKHQITYPHEQIPDHHQQLTRRQQLDNHQQQLSQQQLADHHQQLSQQQLADHHQQLSQQQLADHHQHLSQQQLQGLMNYQD